MVSRGTTDAKQPISWMETPPRSPELRSWNSRLVTRIPWLDKLSTPVQSWLTQFFGQPGQINYRLKDLLSGVWLGHPVHPALVQIPVGAWTATTILDLVWLADQDEGKARGADLLLWLGLASATGAAATGLANWTDTDGLEQRTGMLHAVLNGGATSLNFRLFILVF